MSGANGATGYCQQKGGGRFVAFVEKSGGEKMATKEFLSATKPLARSRALLAACGVAAVAALEPAKAAFPGKNGAIAFTSARDGQPEVYRMRANGSAQRRLSDTAGVANGSPQWSADGQKIVFTSHAAFKDCPQTRIYCVCCTPGGRKASGALFLASSRKGEV
jgi:hypothetical protein